MQNAFPFLQMMVSKRPQRGNNDNNKNRELIERFQNLKALYNLKKNIQRTNQ